MTAPLKNSFIFGKAATITGLIAMLCAIALIYSYNDPTNPTGPLTQFIGNLLYTPPIKPVESTLQAVGTFDLNEKNIRILSTTLVIIFSLGSGILAILASKKESTSLWYALGIALSTAALMMINDLAGIVFMFVCGFICLRNRKWKMTHQ